MKYGFKIIRPIVKVLKSKLSQKTRLLRRFEIAMKLAK